MSGQEYVRIDVAESLSALDYPGTPAPASGVLDGDRFWIGRDAGRVDDRTLVLAVGSNAAPTVLAGKLRRAGATGPVPIVRAEVEGLAVGHSAHVSRGGYVPAAPYARAGPTSTWAAWLTDEQRAAIDATEPNYARIRLRASDYPLRLEGGSPPAFCEVYASRWGVLATDGIPLPLGTQVELHARLADVPGMAILAPWRDPDAAVRALAGRVVRQRFREAIAAASWAADDGLPGVSRSSLGLRRPL